MSTVTLKPLWEAVDAAAATGGRSRRDWHATGVSIDSRTVGAGDLFIALVGPNRDGHGFVAHALRQGAAAAVVTHRPEDVDEDAPLLVVDDTQTALEGLGRFGRARSRARVVGITGSVGKTGTKEALRHVLAGFGRVHASAASHNNHWGVPLTLANLPPDADFAVAELGMNHAGELEALTAMVRPHVAVITAIAPAHLAFFAGTAEIARAKAEILQGLEASGTAIVNGDTPHADLLIEAAYDRAARVIVFGTRSDADVRLVSLDLEASGSRLTVAFGGRRLELALAAPGRHWAMNSLAVLAVADCLGLDLAQAAARLGEVRPLAGRGGQRLLPWQGGRIRLLDESYNANPASVTAALDVLGSQEGRRIAVLGDMLELGEGAGLLHAGLAHAVLAADASKVFLAGPLMRELFDALPAARRGAWAEDSEALAPLLVAALEPGDVVLVKGSLGSAMRRVVEALDGAAAPSATPAGGQGR
ncbi:MAG: UDP-N-acetylmuramoyl-tripeptide--D-alanyl-D-alanine ligase [Geminicoccaceae bacterium]